MASAFEKKAEEKSFLLATKQSIEEEIEATQRIIAQCDGYIDDHQRRIPEKRLEIIEAETSSAIILLDGDIASMEEDIFGLRRFKVDWGKKIEKYEEKLKEVEQKIKEHAEKYGSGSPNPEKN